MTTEKKSSILGSEFIFRGVHKKDKALDYCEKRDEEKLGEEIEPEESATALAIGAHPDDVTVGCGGMLRVLADLGYRVYGVVLTDGERGGDGEERIKEASASARVLGLEDMFFEHLEDGRLHFDVDTVSIIEKYIKDLQPQRVFTHTKQDRHQDHWNCSCATQAAARKGVKEILMYEVYRSTTSSFIPHYITDISETIDWKMKALEMHRSQIRKGTLNLEGVKEHAGSIGKEYGYQYAEAFEINHILFDRERLKMELVFLRNNKMQV